MGQGWRGPKGLGEWDRGSSSYPSPGAPLTGQQCPEPLPPPLLRLYATATRCECQSPELLRGQRQYSHHPRGLQTRTLFPALSWHPGAHPGKPGQSLTPGLPPRCSGSPSGPLQGTWGGGRGLVRPAGARARPKRPPTQGNGPRFYPGVPRTAPPPPQRASCQPTSSCPDSLSSLSSACSMTGPDLLSGRQRPGQASLGPSSAPAPCLRGGGGWSLEPRTGREAVSTSGPNTTCSPGVPPSTPRSGPRCALSPNALGPRGLAYRLRHSGSLSSCGGRKGKAPRSG